MGRGKKKKSIAGERRCGGAIPGEKCGDKSCDVGGENGHLPCWSRVLAPLFYWTPREKHSPLVESNFPTKKYHLSSNSCGNVLV